MVVRVLVADDEKEIRNLLRLYLENESYVVYEAGDGPSTIEAVRENKPDICLLDIMMPGIDGLQVMKMIRRESNIPIIIISARTADAERILGLNLGADDYIPKPFEIEELLARINALFRRVSYTKPRESVERVKPITGTSEDRKTLETCWIVRL